MTIAIDWGTRVISVPLADLTPLGGTSYELDIDTFRLALKNLEDDEAGMPFPNTHEHFPAVTVGGVTLARVIEIINGYTVEFEDGQYGVALVGANSNIADVLVRNQVSVGTSNSAGLVLATVGGIDEQTVRDAMTAQGYTAARGAKLDQLDAAVSSRATSGQGLTIGQAASLATAEAAAAIAASAASNLDVAVSTRAVAGQGLTAGQDAKLTQIDSRVDVAVSTRAAPGQGLTAGQASALALLDVAISTRAVPGQGLTSGEATALAAILTAADVPTSTVAGAVWTRVLDGNVTAEESIRLLNAILGGKVNGAGSGTEAFRDLGDTKDRVVASVDASGNRTAVVRDLA